MTIKTTKNHIQDCIILSLRNKVMQIWQSDITSIYTGNTQCI